MLIRLLIRLLSAALATTLSLPVAAQKLAPGLWEVNMQMPGGPDLGAAMGQMNEALAKMPPEQRKQMQAMLAQKGMATPSAAPAGAGGQPGGMRVCISKEMAARGDMPDPDGRCKQDSLARGGNKVNFKFNCTGEPPSSGTGEYVFSGDKGYQGKMLVNTVRGGKPVSMEMQLSGRFLSADCGEVKPRSPAPKAPA